MNSIATAPVLSLAKKLRRSINNGTKLHLEFEEAAVLLHDEVFPAISRLEAEEMKKKCARDADNDNSLGVIGSGSAPTAARGASVGSSAAEMDAMSRGARLRLSEAMSELKRPKKP
jgi:hypothetical protein